MQNRPSSDRPGFPLAEVLIVLAFLVLLLSVAAYRSWQPVENEDVRIARREVSTIKLALKRYASDVQSFPATQQGLAALAKRPTDGAGTWAGPYIKEGNPPDPWGNAYRYEYPPRQLAVDMPEVWSAGPDGIDATDDDVRGWQQEQVHKK